MTPHRALMKQYGTEDVFLSKTADGTAPLLARLSLGILNYHLADEQQKAEQDEEARNGARYAKGREEDTGRLREATQNLQHTPIPMTVPAGSSLPAGYDEGMVRLASIAAHAGVELAKTAMGIPAGDLLSRGKAFLGGGLGVKGNLALAGGALAAAHVAGKAIPAATRAMSRQSGPAVYGMGRSGQEGLGYSLSYGVNQYGQPQVGTPLG